MVFSEPDSTNSYILGHANGELERLIGQGRFLGDLTAHFLRLAGLQPGMRVLDVGCGARDVSFITASIVGSTGACHRDRSVAGLDHLGVATCRSGGIAERTLRCGRRG
jgi:hypothetical protein